MHPIITAWLAYSDVYDMRPKLSATSWLPWLDELEPLEAWRAELRRLPEGVR